MRAHTYFTLLLGLTLIGGCAANVDEPVDQIPEPPPAAAPPPQEHGGELRFIDPVMQAIINQANEGIGGPLPPKQVPFVLTPPEPGK